MSDSIRFIILATQRTGSNYLQSLLNSHSDVFCAGELLLQPDKVLHHLQSLELPEETLRNLSLAANKRQDIPVIRQFYKLNSHLHRKAIGFRYFYDHVGPLRRVRVLSFFGKKEVRVIHLQRKNLLRQYLSLAMAKETKLWTTSTATKGKPITLDPQDCISYIGKSEKAIKRHRRKFDNNCSINIYYEDLIENRALQLARVQKFLNVAIQPSTSDLKKINNRSLVESIANYEEVRTTLENSPWSSFLLE